MGASRRGEAEEEEGGGSGGAGKRISDRRRSRGSRSSDRRRSRGRRRAGAAGEGKEEEDREASE